MQDHYMHGCCMAIDKLYASQDSVSVNILCVLEGLLIITWLYFPSWPCTLLGCYIFILSWCLSLTYGAATEPRASYALQPYACVTRCALASQSAITTPRYTIFRNLHNVMTWVLIRVKIKIIRSICMTPTVANMHSNTCTISHAS